MTEAGGAYARRAARIRRMREVARRDPSLTSAQLAARFGGSAEAARKATKDLRTTHKRRGQ